VLRDAQVDRVFERAAEGELARQLAAIAAIGRFVEAVRTSARRPSR